MSGDKDMRLPKNVELDTKTKLNANTMSKIGKRKFDFSVKNRCIKLNIEPREFNKTVSAKTVVTKAISIKKAV
jgi:hypothetical protein